MAGVSKDPLLSLYPFLHLRLSRLFACLAGPSKMANTRCHIRGKTRFCPSSEYEEMRNDCPLNTRKNAKLRQVGILVNFGVQTPNSLNTEAQRSGWLSWLLSG